MSARNIAGFVLFGALCSACAQLQRTSAAVQGDAGGAHADEANAQWGGSKLYARDGSVVGDGAQQDSGTAPRELAPSEGGRMYILELYQKAIDQRDALESELGDMRAELDLAREAFGKSDNDLLAAEAKIAQITGENRRLLDENVELAARLTTAQIRRLQVEKLLLETRLDELKAASLPVVAVSAPVAPPASNAGATNASHTEPIKH